MSVLTKVLRSGEGRKVRRLAEVVPHINDLEEEWEALSDAELKNKTVEFKERLSEGETLDDILVEAFATVREASKRVIGQRHYDVQLMGGMALHFGWIAEMKTGEGKTLVSTLPVYLNALSGKGVHVVTVNDYLATRDAEWMGQIHRWLGLSVGILSPDITDFDVKKGAYNCDITYGTNSEFGFDYLRDNMVQTIEHKVQRGHNYAIVDEVDSILIDEARTPLIISGPAQDSSKRYYQFASIVKSLQRDVDYEVDEEKKTVIPTEEGIEKVEKLLDIKNLYDEISTDLVLHLTQALRAKELFKKDKDYIVDKGEVKIVDEFRGRVLEGRRWSEGLHQAVEAKERVKIKEENHTWATVTLQNYFRLYEKLAGMTGTAETEASEFASTYGLAVVPIPTNLPTIREDYPDVIYKTELMKFKAVIEDIKEHYEKGQPILVGTASVNRSEVLSQALTKEGIPHEVLNAKQHFREAEIVAQAGRLHVITVATNMAGRGVDILLGGNPEGLAQKEMLKEKIDPESPEYEKKLQELIDKFKVECQKEGDKVRELGGLYVLGTERHESRRIDNQLRGRSGRQGDPGKSKFYLSMEDDLIRIFANSAVDWVVERGIPDDMPIQFKLVSRGIETAQNAVEGRNAEIRKETLKYDEVLDAQRKVIYGLRDQILEGMVLKDRILNSISTTVTNLVNTYCGNDFQEEWNLEELLVNLTTYYETDFTAEDLKKANSLSQLIDSIVTEFTDLYSKKREQFEDETIFDQIERNLMLSTIDLKWREHLSDMDYLKEGIGLRAMGQQDPLVAWQKEGFEFFEDMIARIDDTFLRYVMHVEVQVEMPTEPDLTKATYAGGSESGDSLSYQLTAGGDTSEGFSGSNVMQLVKSDNEKLGRNEPCWCGSNKKFKYCHGQRQ
jgi:preprotein translocase subunit SecA